jgi:RNA-directed DNA polymerase
MAASGSKNFENLRTQDNLWSAWRHLYRARRLVRGRTQQALDDFKSHEVKSIRRINRQLGNDTFDFGLARGAPIKRVGKSHRPIVIPNVEARIVQRALLEELQRVPGLSRYFSSPHSFGGLPDNNQGKAIAAALAQLNAGAQYYVRSDIREFFTQIPRERAVASLAAPLDARAAALLDRATKVELENADELADLMSIFPTPELGAAQGLCLSPIMGNVVLDEFDHEMNSNGIRCIRFVDDFLLLGPSESTVMAAFEKALGLLAALKMTAYDPRTDSEKANCGPTTHPINFLGCMVERGLVQPNRRARVRIVELIRGLFEESARSFTAPVECYERKLSVARTLQRVAGTLRGWRDAFAFCQNADQVFAAIDSKVDAELRSYLQNFERSFTQAPENQARLLAGIPRISDRKSS